MVRAVVLSTARLVPRLVGKSVQNSKQILPAATCLLFGGAVQLKTSSSSSGLMYARYLTTMAHKDIVFRQVSD